MAPHVAHRPAPAVLALARQAEHHGREDLVQGALQTARIVFDEDEECRDARQQRRQHERVVRRVAQAAVEQLETARVHLVLVLGLRPELQLDARRQQCRSLLVFLR